MNSAVLKRALAAISVIVITAGYGFYRYRERRLDRLYAEAAGVPPASHGSKEAQAAVRELGKHHGAKSTRMLLSIALGQTSFTWPDVQREAINALAARNDPSISTALAHALQPHQPLPTRQAAAEALRTLPCTAECIGAVLHYLERVWQGEPNYEDRTSFSTGLNEDVRAGVAKQQDVLYQTLFAVLKREDRLTLGTLVQVYGLGTDAASRFSLALVIRMGFRQACPAILQSEQLVKQSSAESFRAPREEIEKALRSLECR
ncbi:MAG: HEAT repeat domain-containing protein [Acidobacteria bacterium]|nr:HEAT repeat domain-containing protein [Acidobacteriota bacterium]